MMKKLLSIIMSVCMLLTLVAVPVNVFAAETEVAYEDTTLGTYYKFTFGEDEIYDYTFGAAETYKENTFYPLWATGTTGNKVGYKAVTDVATGEVYDTLEIVNGSSAAQFTPLTKDGKPFELKPGTEYKVKVNMFNPVSHCYNQVYITAGSDSKVVGSSTDSNMIEYPDGLYPTNFYAANHPFFLRTPSFSVQGGSAYACYFLDGTYGKSTTYGTCLHSVIGGTCISSCTTYGYVNAKPYINKSATFTLDANSYRYNEDTASYSADMTAYNFVKLTAEPEDWAENYASYYVYESWTYKSNSNADFTAGTYYKKVKSADVDCNNYLTLYLGGGDATQYLSSPLYGTAAATDIIDSETEKAIPAYETYQIESIEVYEVGYAAVNFHVGDEVTTVTGTPGETASLYIPEAPEGQYFVGWYSDVDYTTLVTAAPTLAEGAPLNLYARFANYGTDLVLNLDGVFPGHGTYAWLNADNAYQYRVENTSGWNMNATGTVGKFKFGLDEGSVAFTTNTPWNQSGGVAFVNDDGTLFVPEANASYKFTVSARFSNKAIQQSSVSSDPQVTFSIGYGRTLAAAAAASGNGFSKYTTGVTLTSVSKEYQDYVFEYTTPAASATVVPCFGIYTTITGATDVLTQLTAQPDDWAENYTAYYYFDDATGEYVAASGDTAPEFTGETYYSLARSTTRGDATIANVLQVAEIKVEKIKNTSVTYINADGSTNSTAIFAVGDTITYPALTANINYDYVWSLSDKEYIPAPLTATNDEDITVYAYQNPVLSFENRVPFTYGSNVYYNVATSEEQACSGNKSVKFTNTVNNSTLEGQTPIHDFGTYKAEEYVFTYKITFRYLATANNTADSSFTANLLTYSNPWNGLAGGNSNKNLSVVGVTVSAGATDGWQTAVMYVSHNGTVYSNETACKLYLYLKFVPAAKDGDTITNEIYVDDLVIEEVESVTFVSYSGSKSAGFYNVGDTIAYPTTPSAYNTHYVWSLSQDEYIPAPITLSESITVYQINSDVNSFQTDIPTDPYMFKPVTPSIQYSSEGAGDHRAMRVKNYGVAQRTAQPANWTDTSYSKEKYYDAATDSYKFITAEMYNDPDVAGDYDAFVAKYGAVYENRGSGNNVEQANLPVYQYSVTDKSVTQNVKITFKYKFKDNPSQSGVRVYGLLGNHSNIWPTSTNYRPLSDQNIVLPYSDSDEWQTATLYVVLDNVNANDTSPLFALKFEDAANGKNMETFEILVDDVLLEEVDGLHVNTDEKVTVENKESVNLNQTVEDGHTYKVSYWYTANNDNGKFGLEFRTAISSDLVDDTVRYISTIAANTATGEWTKVTAYFTVDLLGIVNDDAEYGTDYNVSYDLYTTLYANFFQDANEAGNDIYFADFEVVDLGEAILTGGASILTEAAANEAGMQAMRYYFDYETVDGSTITIGDETFDVVERGFIYRNGKLAKDDKEKEFTVETAGLKKQKTDKFEECWSYNDETGMMRFSTYVTGFGLEDDGRKLEVRAYIVVEAADGSQYTIYSNSINRTVAGVGAGIDGDINNGQ